ncbi:MAG: HIT domain-containing protein [Caldilineales bacterium]|nr:HIT domain-containing protein [Caldilineales bacterium]
MNDCIFCKIVRGDLPAHVIHNGPNTLAFHDIQPQAPVHVLIIPTRHIDHIRDAHAFSDGLLDEMFQTANQAAELLGVAESGYRLLFNYGADANLVVPHLHLHLLGGKSLGRMVCA